MYAISVGNTANKHGINKSTWTGESLEIDSSSTGLVSSRPPIASGTRALRFIDATLTTHRHQVPIAIRCSAELATLLAGTHNQIEPFTIDQRILWAAI